MAGRDLKLQVVFSALDRITAPLKKIRAAVAPTSKTLQEVSQRLKGLNEKLKETKYLRKLQDEFRSTSQELKKSKLALNDTRAALDNQRLAQHKLASETRAARTEFKGLQLELMRTKEPSGKLAASFALARDNLTKLELKYSQSQEKLRSLKAALGQTEAAVTKISASKLKLAQNLTIVRQKMDAAGTSTSKMRQHERTLATDIAATNAQLEIQQKKLATLKIRQDRVATAQQSAAKAKTVAGGMASAGASATVAGAAIGAPVVKGLHEAKHYEIETARIRALGTRTSQEKEHAIQFAKELKTYGVSQLEKTEMIRDSISIFADGHHAEMALPTMSKMKFINDTLYPDSAGERNAQLFAMQKVIELRGNAGSVEAFKSDADRVQKIIAATGGRVSGEEWRQFTIRSGVAGKGLNDNAFFNQMEPMLQELGGSTAGVGFRSLYNNIYQGKGTQRAAREMQALGLLSGKHIKYDKVGQIKYIQAGALLEGELFQKSPLDWIEKVFLPKLAAKGITDQDEINSKIGALVSNSNGAAFLMRMVDQRLQIRKSERLNQQTEGMDSQYVRARGLGAGGEREAHAKLSDLKLVMGEKILPLYTQALQMAIAAVTRLNSFMERNPTVAKAMIIGFSVLAGLLLVIGPIMLGIAALVGPYAMLHVMFAKMGVTGGVLTPMLRGLGGAFMWAGRAVLWLGRALTLTPIGIAVTVIAGAAFLIYKYWEPIKGFFTGLWSTVKAAFAGGFVGVNSLIADWSPLGLFYRAFAGVLGWLGIDLPARFTDFAASMRERFVLGMAPLAGFFSGLWSQINAASAGGIGSFTALIANWSPLGVFYRAFAGVLGWFGIELPAKFTDYGANVIRGLVNGITSSMGLVKDAISNAGSSTIAWFKEKLGIHSPSRVFAQLGDYTMQGLTIGLARSEGTSLAQVSGLAKRLTQIGASIAIGTAVGPAAALGQQPSVDAPANSKPVRQVGELLPREVHGKVAPAPAALRDIRQAATPAPNTDALYQVTDLSRQLAQAKAVPAPAAPIEVRPLVQVSTLPSPAVPPEAHPMFTPAPNNDALHQVNALVRQLAQDKAVPAPAAPLDTRLLAMPTPNTDALRQVNALARQLVQDKAVPTPTAPLDARPPVTPAPNSDALRQVNALTRQRVQANPVPTPAMQLDARPLATPALNSDALRQASTLARQLAQDKAVPAPAAPLDARPLVTPAPNNDALRQVSALTRQLAQAKAVPTPAAPLDARPPVTPAPNSDTLRQVSTLARQLVQDKATPTPAAPLDARPLVTPTPNSDVLRQATTLVRQLVQDKAAPAPAAPLDARPPVKPAPNSDTLRQVSTLARQLVQDKAAPTPAAPLDARPLATPAPNSDALRQASALVRQLVQDKAVPTPAALLNARPLATPAPNSGALRQVSALARQLAQDKAVPTPAAPLDARPLVTPAPNSDALRQATSLARQLAQDKAVSAPAATLDARPLVTPAPSSDVLRQVNALARQLAQDNVVPTPAAPLDARPLATPAPNSDALRQAATLARQFVQANPVPAPAAPLDARPMATPAPNSDALRQVSGLARQLAQLGAEININGGSDAPAIAFDTRPPVTMHGHTATYDSHDTVQIHIAPTPGMDPQAIARAVYAAMEQRDREKAARMRSSLYDRE